eukprot:6189105-Prymnesium_polylepis.2
MGLASFAVRAAVFGATGDVLWAVTRADCTWSGGLPTGLANLLDRGRWRNPRLDVLTIVDQTSSTTFPSKTLTVQASSPQAVARLLEKAAAISLSTKTHAHSGHTCVPMSLHNKINGRQNSLPK